MEAKKKEFPRNNFTINKLKSQTLYENLYVQEEAELLYRCALEKLSDFVKLSIYIDDKNHSKSLFF